MARTKKTVDANAAAGSDETPKPSETPEQLFVRIANGRVLKALEAIEMLERMKTYKAAPQYAGKVCETLIARVERIRAAWTGKSTGFQL